ncbi:general secretion pathway protein GspD [Aestuariibacter sp. AA17]|uniref:General secretion pathway protein GspD n=1 Tax=Fluctibacter corallii TaxID=2984329 RepID=A0ABT3A3M7_9ALTE|nr:secretin N-terminal domain-containing protein [Aestuariibacter sp. AA17]MCV2883287.1 general secretion pathway protein GspD [Aestuariibacter sp. AA17]
MKRIQLVSFCCAFVLSGCASLSGDQKAGYITPSYLESDADVVNAEALPTQKESNEQQRGKLTRLTNEQAQGFNMPRRTDLANRFPDEKTVSLQTEALALNDWLHYVLGDILQINYVLDTKAKSDAEPVTLAISDNISKKRLFLLSEELLGQRGYHIHFDNDIFYITQQQSDNAGRDVMYGFGKSPENVPQTSREVFQIVPLEYGVRNNYNALLQNLTNAKYTIDFEQGIYYIRGKREDVVKALEFLNIIDTPFYQSKHMGMAELVFMSPEQFMQDIQKLLQNEGISVSEGQAVGKSVVLIPLDHIGSVAIFASSQAVLDRVDYWINQLDKPTKGGGSQYFIYQPKLARATDLIASLAPLINPGQNGRSAGNSAPTPSAQQSNDQGNNRRGNRNNNAPAVTSASNSDMQIVVDERSNALIVFASGEKYQQLLPLMKRLDVLPRQVMLEVVIAEISLRDEFKFGVDFFLKENNYTLGNKGTMGLDKIGGLSYVLTGSNDWDVNANLNAKDTLVNVVSRPSLVVRDGVSATMEIKTDIPIASATIVPDSGTILDTVQFRETGLTLEVRPTVNSQGVVIMEISQKISNTLSDGISVGDTPSIFERSMTTEVVASSGQTIVLGGLISENVNNTHSKVPVLGDIPVLGNLFSSKSDVKDRTELVVIVTPRIIEEREQWEDIKSQFKNSMQQLSF